MLYQGIACDNTQCLLILVPGRKLTMYTLSAVLVSYVMSLCTREKPAIAGSPSLLQAL